MKKKIIAGAAILSLISGTAGAAGNYFWLNGFNEELQQELSPEIVKATAKLESKKQKLFEFGQKQAEKEKEYIRKETNKYLKQRIEQAETSLGTQHEIELQVKAESDQMITEINTFIDEKFSEKGF